MSNTPPSPLMSCVVFEFKKLLGRRLPWIILACVLLSVAGSYALEKTAFTANEGYSVYAAILKRAMPLASFLVMIMATLSVNEEIAAGSLRAVLLRPISKANLISAKLILNILFSLFLTVVVLASAWAVTKVGFEFGAVLIEISGLEPQVVFTPEEMRAISWKLSLATIPPVIAAAAFGTLISVVIESEGTSVAIGTFFFLAMQAVGPLVPEASPYLFPSYLELPISLLGELAGQDQTRQKIVDNWGALSSGYLAPLAMIVAFGGLSALIFEKKEIAC